LELISPKLGYTMYLGQETYWLSFRAKMSKFKVTSGENTYEGHSKQYESTAGIWLPIMYCIVTVSLVCSIFERACKASQAVSGSRTTRMSADWWSVGGAHQSTSERIWTARLLPADTPPAASWCIRQVHRFAYLNLKLSDTYMFFPQSVFVMTVVFQQTCRSISDDSTYLKP